MAVLTFDKVGKTYSGARTVTPFSNVSFSIEKNEFITLHGASGCGKSTLLLVAGGLLSPDIGIVTVGNRDLYALSSNKRALYRAENIGFVFQQFHLIPYLTVEENVLVPSVALKEKKDQAQKAETLLKHFNLIDRRKHYPSELSTGERQRTALARALLNDPQIILADEPTGYLDKKNADIVLGYLSEYAQNGGAVFLVTHDNRVAHYTQKMFHLDDGILHKE